jgi:hypothetical protein
MSELERRLEAYETLRPVRVAAATRRRAEGEYRAAIVAAVRELEAAGDPAPYARTAEAAGVTRQTVRRLVERFDARAWQRFDRSDDGAGA